SIRKVRSLSFPIRKGEVLSVKIIGEGWKVGETLAVARERVMTVLDVPPVPLGSYVRVRVIRDKDNILYARFIGRGV
ncbi:MAG: radical SAM protein, partial [Candidatus Korarchaeum sp.]|nr:radical SAM protein [Candidatus Korarchaeum sp.]MDW8035808.1 radical SAM protein [Candidatus Korarchaeum sp.]